jgi:hypothetical protein
MGVAILQSLERFDFRPEGISAVGRWGKSHGRALDTSEKEDCDDKRRTHDGNTG